MTLIYPPLPPTSKNLLHHFVQEHSPQYTKHDQLFKQLIENFFEEFLDVFFPQVHEHIDFEHISFLSG